MTDLEMLLIAADAVLHPRDGILEAPEGTDGDDLALVRLAIAFARSPASLRFRALVEGWDRLRLVRELY